MDASTCNLGTFSLGIRFKSNLSTMLAGASLHYWPTRFNVKNLDAVLGWGYRGKSRLAEKFARRHGLPFIRLEDGWIRSLGLHGRWAQTLSVVQDDIGIYYDATRPSRLEKLITEADFDEATLASARALRQRLIELKASKYNHAPPAPKLPGGEKVLVADQTLGDLSIHYGLANQASFTRMLDAALAEHPDATIYLKVHPQVVAGERKGHFDLDSLPERVQVLGEDVNPIGLLEQMDHVHVVSSQLGFEALMLGKLVTCHGMPYYAGWGLTDDRVQCERRDIKRSLDEVFAAAYLEYASYYNPLKRQACDLEELLDYLELQLNKNHGRFFCVGFRYWKHYIVRAFLQGPASTMIFCKGLDEAKSRGITSGDRMVIWASNETPEEVDYCQAENISLIRVEDGFLRSVGLGSDFVTPVSWVLDDEGIYYDPGRPSRLETILQTTAFTGQELERAADIRRRLVQSGVTKYNLAADAELEFEGETGRKKILVPGQVEDDASVERGGGAIQDNLTLLQKVREENPGAFILFKPHPDVESGNRRRKSPVVGLKNACDAYVTDVDIVACMKWADEVHTLTSLTGFEALLREVPVTTYGHPFYAGWGLTADHTNQPRRTRKLGIDALVAGVLIYYPRYYHWPTRNFMSPEMAIDILMQSKQANYGSVRKKIGNPVPFVHHAVIKARQLSNVVRYFQLG